MGPTKRAMHAEHAWRAARRRRGTAAVVGSAADAAIATGGLLFANATFGLGIGLPAGRAGIACGAALIASGVSALRSHRRRGNTAIEVPVPITGITIARRNAA